MFVRFRADDYVKGLNHLADVMDEDSKGRFVESIAEVVTRVSAEVEKASRQRARRTLPARGGLAGVVARTEMETVTRRFQHAVQVNLNALPGAVRDPEAIDRGRVRHPVFGRWPDPPLIQLVPAGWFTVPTVKLAVMAREELEQILLDERARLEKGSGG